MNMRSGSRARYRGTKRQVRNVSFFKIMPQPQTLRLLRIQRHIHLFLWSKPKP